MISRPFNAFNANTITSVRSKLFDFLNNKNKYKNKFFLNATPMVHPLTNIINKLETEGSLNHIYFNSTEFNFLHQLRNSNNFFILNQHYPILETFYEAKKKDSSPLGKLYSDMLFQDFLIRLITKKFTSIYTDGRLILPRQHDDQFTQAFVQKMKQYDSSRDLLESIGTLSDDVFYKEYLSLEEAAISSLIVPHAYFLPIADGRRTQHSPLLHPFNLQRGNVVDEFENAHPYPVAISYIAAPEFRNCFSLQYDVLACVRFQDFHREEVKNLMKRQMLAMNQAGFSSVLNFIYGDEHALNNQVTKKSDVISFESNIYGKGIFYKNAYKNRLKQNFYQLLTLANFSLVDKGALNVKGMSLGAFAIEELIYPMELIFKQALKEVIAELKPTQIGKINLINFPSSINKYIDSDDLEYISSIFHKTASYKFELQQTEIEMNTCIGPPLAKQDDLLLATHVCGDSLSYPGNEVHAGLPPKVSSDDSVMHFSTGGFYSMIKDIQSPVENILKKVYVLKNNVATLWQSKKALDQTENKSEIMESTKKVGLS